MEGFRPPGQNQGNPNLFSITGGPSKDVMFCLVRVNVGDLRTVLGQRRRTERPSGPSGVGDLRKNCGGKWARIFHSQGVRGVEGIGTRGGVVVLSDTNVDGHKVQAVNPCRGPCDYPRQLEHGLRISDPNYD